jgi:two-component system, cell cycle sensor histidine kinase and response regulator CckA
MNARTLGHQTRFHPTNEPCILVVDDEPAVRRITTRTLVDAGYAVLDVESGAGALQMLDLIGERIRILLTDVAMPEMDGRELGTRAQHRWPRLRVLYVSAMTEGDAVGKGEGTAQPFLRKPFDAPGLLAFVAQTGGLAPSNMWTRNDRIE